MPALPDLTLKRLAAFLPSCAVLAGTWALVFVQYFTGRRVIPYDSLEAYYPFAFFNAQSIRHGEWPWWNPHIFSGHPQVADPQGLVFSPVLGALMLLPERPGVVWFDFCVLACVLIGSWGMLAFMRRRGIAAPACVLAAMVFMVGGAASARLQHTTFILAYACAPWTLLCLQRMLARPTLAAGAALGLACGVMLTHLVQVAYLMLLVLALFGVFELARTPREAPRPGARALLRSCLVAAVLATCIAGPQLAATLAFLPLSTRGSFSLETVAANSLPPDVLLTLLWPNVYGTLDGTYAGPADITESFLFIGIVPLTLLLLNARPTLSDRFDRGTKIFAVVTCTIGVLYFLGAHTPFFPTAFRFLPGVDLFRRPSDGAFVLNLGLALLAGYAADRFLRIDDDARFRRHAVRIALAVAAWHLALAALERWNEHAALAIAAAGVVALGAAFLIAGTPPARARTVAIVALLVLCIADARMFNLPNRMNSGGRDALREFEAPGTMVRELQREMAMAPMAPPFRIEPIETRDLVATNGALVQGFYSTQGYSPISVRAYDDLFGAQATGNAPRRFTAALPSLDSNLFDLSGARYVVTGRPLSELVGDNATGHFERVDTERGRILWRNTHAYPRILTPHEAIVVPWATAPGAPQFHTVDFRDVVLLHPQDGAALARAQAAAVTCRGRARLQNVHYDNTLVSFDASTDDPAWVTISDVHFPGWRAFADDETLEVWRANGPFRAICVPAGNHHVRMEFTLRALIRDGMIAPRLGH